VLFLLMLRIVNSPFGRVLLAVRDNELRAEAIGYRPVVYRTLSSMCSAVFATLSGALMVLWVRYTGPDTTLSLEIMLNLLLMLVIGGMATMYGSVVGAVVFISAQSYIQNLLALTHGMAVHVPLVGAALGQLFAPARWLLWLGVLFVVCIYFFPRGVVGELRIRAIRKAAA
jgi:branched-chain amino acid transport system permease protein